MNIYAMNKSKTIESETNLIVASELYTNPKHSNA